MPPKPFTKPPSTAPVPKPWTAPFKPKPRFIPTGDLQLDALLQMKEVVDETGELDKDWDRKKGYNRGYCR
jgi:hypothetical protein